MRVEEQLEQKWEAVDDGERLWWSPGTAQETLPSLTCRIGPTPHKCSGLETSASNSFCPSPESPPKTQSSCPGGYIAHSNTVTTMLFNSGVFKRPKSYFFKISFSISGSSTWSCVKRWFCCLLDVWNLLLVVATAFNPGSNSGIIAFLPYSCNVTF